MKLLPISEDDYNWLAPFFVGQPHELCEYSLPGVLAWSSASFFPCAAVRGDRLILGAEYPGHSNYRHLLLPLGGEEPSPDPQELKVIADEAGYPAYWFVPQTYLDQHGMARISQFFQVSEQPDYHDYVYSVPDLTELKGNRYAKKRNLIKQFERGYSPERIVFEPISAANSKPCIAFLEEWCEQEGCFEKENASLECEMEAAVAMLGLVERGRAKGLVLKIDTVISALAMASPLTENMVVLQFQKACKKIKGLYQFFDRECARRLCQGFLWVNKESDMGRKGLAHAKRSYHPVRMSCSFELRLRQEA
ncbi:MAG: phosphatidylglycerol lysyltransferase domain-containing protein [Desulfobulbaceae bacterium]|nr:phosphatidylglycerol lysyltransferase domain-containing protein [Desulfobulbaceae bacterium]